MTDDLYAEDRREELESLAAIYPELVAGPDASFSARLVLDVAPLVPLEVRFVPAPAPPGGGGGSGPGAGDAGAASHAFSRLPPLEVSVALPPGTSATGRRVRLGTTPAWLPAATLDGLAARVPALWEAAGRAAVVYDVVVFLEQEIEAGFGLAAGEAGSTSSTRGYGWPARLQRAGGGGAL